MKAEDRPGTRLRLALGDLAADRTRSLLTVAALVPLAVGYLVLAVVGEGLLVAAGDPPPADNLLVVPVNVLDPTTGRLDEEDLAVARERAGDDVREVSGVILRASTVSGHILQLRAAPLDTWTDVHGLQLARGTWPEDDEIVVTEGITTFTGWDVGTLASVYGREFRVSGIVVAPGTKFATVWMPLDTAEDVFDSEDAYQMLVLTLRPGADADAVADRVTSAPRLDGRVEAFRESLVESEVAETVSFASWLVYLAAGLALAALAFAVFNALSVSFLERRSDVGVLRLLGFEPATIRSIVRTRTLALAVAAYAAGIAVAVPYLSRTPPIVLRSVTLDLGVSAATIGGGLAAVLVFAAVAAWAAVRRVLAVPVHELVARR